MRLFTRLLFAILLVACELSAQVADPVAAAQAPQPGSGHHYIGLGTENVNPADGSLTFHLNIPTPKGRGLSFPFGIRYSSAEQYYLANPGNSSTVQWIARPSTPWGETAWNYDLPILTGAARVLFLRPHVNQANGQIDGWYQCDASLNYEFRGFDSKQYTLGLGGQWDDPNHLSGACTAGNPPVGPSGGHGISAAVPGGSTWTQWPLQPPVNVTDQSGTVYHFPGTSYGVSVPQSGPNPTWGTLAQTVTDRNGNQITLNSNSDGYVDTLGRSVVTWSGQPGGVGQISVSGYSTAYQLTTTSVSTSFPEAISGGCAVGSSPAQNSSGIYKITLPNGQAYTFGYDPTYGHVSSITFPEGGSVRYTWGSKSAVSRRGIPVGQHGGHRQLQRHV